MRARQVQQHNVGLERLQHLVAETHTFHRSGSEVVNHNVGGGDQVFIQTSAHAGAKRPDPSTDEGKQLTQVRLDTMEGEFLAAVAEGRGIAVDDVPGRMSRTDNAADGGDVFWGADAISRGLVDAEETLPDFLARIGGLYAPKPRSKTRAAMALAEAAQAQASL